MPVCRQVDVLLQSGQTRSPIWLDWNEPEHIRHFLTFGCKFSACGFLFISERDAIKFLHWHDVYNNLLVICFLLQPPIGRVIITPTGYAPRFFEPFLTGIVYFIVGICFQLPMQKLHALYEILYGRKTAEFRRCQPLSCAGVSKIREFKTSFISRVWQIIYK